MINEETKEVVLDEDEKEGIEQNPGTSPETEQEPEQQPELNSTPVPTEEDKEDAGIVEDEATEVVEEPEAAAEPAQDPFEGTATESFTQSQVNELIGRTRVETRDKTLKNMFARYGVNSDEELDDLFGDAQRFGTLRETYDSDKKAWEDERKAWAQERDAQCKELSEVKEKVALLESGIDRERFEDAKYILRGKGLEITAENINSELATHPEWKSVVNEPKAESHFVKKTEPSTKLSVLGNDAAPAKNEALTEREQAAKLFKDVKF